MGKKCSKLCATLSCGPWLKDPEIKKALWWGFLYCSCWRSSRPAIIFGGAQYYLPNTSFSIFCSFFICQTPIKQIYFLYWRILVIQYSDFRIFRGGHHLAPQFFSASITFSLGVSSTTFALPNALKSTNRSFPSTTFLSTCIACRK